MQAALFRNTFKPTPEKHTEEQQQACEPAKSTLLTCCFFPCMHRIDPYSSFPFFLTGFDTLPTSSQHLRLHKYTYSIHFSQFLPSRRCVFSSSFMIHCTATRCTVSSRSSKGQQRSLRHRTLAHVSSSNLLLLFSVG